MLRHRLIFGMVIFAICLIINLPVAANEVKPAEENKLQEMIRNTKREILQYKKKERSALYDLLKQQKELGKLEDNYDQVKSRLEKTQSNVTQTRQELNELQRSYGLLEQDLENRRKLMNERLVAVYKYGPQTYLEILWNSRNFGDLVTRFTSVVYFVKADFRVIHKYEAAKIEVSEKQAEVQEKKQVVETEYQKMLSLRDQVARQQQKIVSKVNGTKQELNKIQSNRENLEKALGELEQTSRELQEQIRRDQLGTQGRILGTGNYTWPVRGRITSNFGWRNHPVLKKKKYHSGIDLAVPSGTPVLAADSGVVLVSGWRGGYGYFIAIDHGREISTCYGHNSRLLVNAGETVYKGQKIALSGNTGLSTGPHLHFEVRVKGAPANPMSYLP